MLFMNEVKPAENLRDEEWHSLKSENVLQDLAGSRDGLAAAHN